MRAALEISILVVALLAGCDKRMPVIKSAELFLESGDSNLGVVSPKVTINTKLFLVNRSDKVVKISRISKSCRCTEVSPLSSSIGPGQKLEMPVSISTPSESGEFLTEIFIYTDFQVDPVRAGLRANVVRSLQTEIDVCDFGSVGRMDVPEKRVRVRIIERNFSGPITVESSKGASCVLANVEDNSFFADVQLKCDRLTGGLIKEWVSFRAFDERGTPLELLRLPLHGRYDTGFRVDPKTIYLGVIPKGFEKSFRLAVLDLRPEGEKTKIRAVPSTDFIKVSESKQDKQQAVFELNVTGPDRLGACHETINLVTDAGDVVYRVPVIGLIKD